MSIYFDIKDHAGDHPKATKASFISGIPRIHHNKCGGRVRMRDHWDTVWHCYGCEAEWGEYQIDRFGDSDIARRFHLRGDIDPQGYSLVWKTDKGSKQLYTALVPNHEANKYDIVKF